jgi:hypothetical protein
MIARTSKFVLELLPLLLSALIGIFIVAASLPSWAHGPQGLGVPGVSSRFGQNASHAAYDDHVAFGRDRRVLGKAAVTDGLAYR